MRQILGLLVLVFISCKMGSTAVHFSRCLALVEGIGKPKSHYLFLCKKF